MRMKSDTLVVVAHSGVVVSALIRRAPRDLFGSLSFRPFSWFFNWKMKASGVGDLYMSLIETCRLCGANPVEYRTALQQHARLVTQNPEHWLPWNYGTALAALDTS